MHSKEKIRKKEKTDNGLLISGVLVLTFASILGKIFGFIYKVPLNNILGDEMANVNSAYAIYTTLYMVSTAGIPVAVSVLISEGRAVLNKRQVSSVYRISMTALAVVGFFCTLVMIFAAGPISEKNSGGDTFLCMLAIAPALIFIAISSVYRGYFQGFGIMTPTAVSQLIESFGKMAIGLLLAYVGVRGYGMGTDVAAALSILGVTLGIAAGTVYLMISKLYYSKKGLFAYPQPSDTKSEQLELLSDKKSKILKSLALIAFPIAISSAVMSLASLVDSQMMRPLLERFYENGDIAKAIYSDYSTGAVTMFNMPLVLISPISCAIVPFITTAIAQKRMRDATKIMESSLRVTSIVAFPCAFGMSALAGPILSLVFRGDEDMASNAGDLLSVLAISIFLVGMLSVTNSVLQSHHLQSLPIISMSAGLLVKTVSAYLLIGRIGELGAPVSTLLFYLTVVIFNFFFVVRYVHLAPSLTGVFIRPMIAALLCALSAWGVYRVFFDIIGLTPSVLLAIAAAIAVYAALLFLLKCVTRDDISLLPHSERILSVLSSLRLIR